MPDQTLRLIARAEGASVSGGIDIPIAGARSSQFRWAAGALYDPIDKRYGAFVDRDLGRLRLGIDLMQDSRQDGLAAVVRVGVRF